MSVSRLKSLHRLQSHQTKCSPVCVLMKHFVATANARSADSGGAGCLLGTTGLQKVPEGMIETCVQPGPLEEERGL